MAVDTGATQAFGVIPFVGGLASIGAQAATDQANMQELGDQRDRWDKMALPGYNGNQLTPQTYAPGAYKDPTLGAATMANIDPRDRAAQLGAMQQLSSQGSGYAAALNDSQARQAQMQAAQMAQGQQSAIQQQMASRGMGNSGMSMVLQAQAGQDAANRANMGGLQAAQQSAMARLAATQGYNQALSNFRGQDQDQATTNADIMNRFNMYNTNLKNTTNNANTDLTNHAQQYNIGNNTQAQQYNLNRGDRNADQSFSDRMAREGARSGITQQMVGTADADSRAMGAQAAAQRSSWEKMMTMGMGAGGGGGGGGGGMMGGMGGMMGGGGGG